MAESKEKNSSKARGGSFLKELLSGIIITDKIVLKNLWYFLLLTLLGAIYIGNRFHAERITRETARLAREVKDLRAESLSTSTDLMYVSKQSEVFRLVGEKGLGLEELKTPPYKLVVDKK
ncbi:MAG TPA: FtsL-like putative cell division protein [Bacteroidales bacterium]|nr:FtsL-like putative cell division protein [Bacteroidales bacterium]